MTSPAPPAASPRRPRSRAGRALDLAAVALVTLVALVPVALVVVRLVFHDERLRGLAVEELQRRLATEVELGALELSLCSGLELRGLRVGPLPGFREETLGVERLAVHWSALELLRLRVIIDELAIEGVRATFEEEAEAGRNVDALLRALLGPPSAAPPPATPPPSPPPAGPPEPLRQPSLPVRVEVRRIAVLVDALRVRQPALQVDVGALGLLGRFAGQGEALELALWAGLGAPPPGREPMRLAVAGEGVPPVSVVQRLDVSLTSSGFGAVALRVDWDALAEVGGERPLPPVRLRGAVAVDADLLAQRVELGRCRWTVNERTELTLAAAASQVLSEPQARLTALQLRADLDELAPLVAAFVPGLELGGALRLEAEPFVVPLTPAAAAGVTAQIDLTLARFGVRLGDLRVEGLELELGLGADDGTGTLGVRTRLARALAAGQEARDVALTLEVATPLAPWLGAEPAGAVTATGRLTVADAGGPAGRARGLALDLRLDAPVALVQRRASEQPLTAQVTLAVAQAAAATAELRRVGLSLDASTWDLAGQTVEATLGADLGGVTVAVGPDRVSLEPIRLRLRAARRGARAELGELSLSVADVVTLSVRGAVTGFDGPAPIVEGLELRVGPIALARLLQLAPESQRPKLELAGQLGLQARVHGQIPYVALGQRMQPPVLGAAESADLALLMQTYAAYAERWQALFAEGLPFVANVDLSLADVGFTDAANALRGLNLDVGVALERHGPAMTATLVIDEVLRPAVARGARLDLRLGFAEGALELAIGGGAEELVAAGLARPLAELGVEARMAYRLGGDLAVDTLAVRLAEPAVLAAASGVVSRPLQLALARGWEKPGLPGVAAALRWQLGFDAGPTLRALTVDGPKLAGRVGLSGQVRAEDGLVTIDGALDVDAVHAEQGDTVLTDLSGRLPLELRLSFDPRDDYTVLRRGVPLGSGVVALRTAAEDIRKRAARPAYYERLRPYQRRSGLTARALRAGPYTISDFALDGRVTQGMLLIDWLSLHLLGGDIQGHLGVQLGRDASLRTDLAVKFTNLDASYFPALKLEPGPQSELSADLQLGFLAAPGGRDLTLNMNVTKIGSQTLDRFLQLLDPQGEKEAIQSARGNLWLVKIDEVKSWIRYENLNLDLAVTTFLRIPWTSIGYPNLDRELLRGFSLSDYLDAYLQPQIDGVLAPALGWNDAG